MHAICPWAACQNRDSLCYGTNCTRDQANPVVVEQSLWLSSTMFQWAAMDRLPVLGVFPLHVCLGPRAAKGPL